MYLKKPDRTHKAFRIIDPSTKPRSTTVTGNAELDAINAEFLAGKLPFHEAHEQCKIVAKKLRKPKPVSWLPANHSLAMQYWAARIKPKRQNVAPREAKRRVLWAVEQVATTSILAASEEELYQALSHLEPSAKKRAASVLNAIMRWKGLEKFIQVERVPKKEPRYLTLQELLSFSLPVREWQLCVLSAFATGCRYGELFTITPFSLREEGTHVYIAQQVKRDGGLHEIKNRKTGTALIIKELRPYVAEWAQVPQDVKIAMREKGLPGEMFKEAAFKALRRHLTFHNLRHSYARCLLTRNEGLWVGRDAATLEDLRQWMRDRMSTVEHYYTSWVVTSSQMRSNTKRFG